ncbi:MAG: thioredoxin family protein [Bacillota bacterium]|jgi:thioredoxin 1|nr:thioredoxin family protein [Candidatus Fermentithermobacillaceae bacterium]
MNTCPLAVLTGNRCFRIVALVLVLLVAAGGWYWNMAQTPKLNPDEITIDDISPEDLSSYLTGEKRGILEFYTNSCPYCVMIEPELAELKAKYGEEVFIVKISAERYPEEASKYRIRGVPTLVFLDQSGNAKASLAGYRDSEGIARILKHLGFIE